MRARVTQTLNEHGTLIATLDTALGTFQARWANANFPALRGVEYDVEFDIEVPAESGLNTHVSDAATPGVQSMRGSAIIDATVESVDADGVAALRLAQDCLLMVETRGSFDAGDMVRITIPIAGLSATATGS